jgi:hypothetical protein
MINDGPQIERSVDERVMWKRDFVTAPFSRITTKIDHKRRCRMQTLDHLKISNLQGDSTIFFDIWNF